VLGKQRGGGLLVAGVQPDGQVAVLRRGGLLRAGEVVVGHHQVGEPAPGGDPGKSGADATGADEEDAHSGDLSLLRCCRPTGPVIFFISDNGNRC
jgi:hypothetical protein